MISLKETIWNRFIFGKEFNMTKKQIGKIIACITVFSLFLAGCILYFHKRRNHQTSLNDDFSNFKDEYEESTDAQTAERSYVSIPFEPTDTEPKKE
jgi:hypothetical protein